MNKLWLSAIATACLLAGNAAQAGEHHGDSRGGHGDWDRGHAEERHDGNRGYREGWRDHDRVYYRPVYYAHPVVYGRPVYYSRPVYYERPAYYGHAYSGYDGEIHGSITVGF